MTIAKHLRLAALIAGLSIGVVAARAADDAKETDSYWIVKRTGSTVQLLPANEDTLQPLLKKQAPADSTKPSSKAKAADERTTAKTAAAPATAGSVKTEPKCLPPSTMCARLVRRQVRLRRIRRCR